MGACLFMPPAILSFLVHFKPVDIMLDGGDPIPSSCQLRNQFFEQGGLSTIRFSNNRNNGNQLTKPPSRGGGFEGSRVRVLIFRRFRKVFKYF
jgi:hypothetical protein